MRYEFKMFQEGERLPNGDLISRGVLRRLAHQVVGRTVNVAWAPELEGEIVSTRLEYEESEGKAALFVEVETDE